jgi:hypothetical protein
MAQKYPYIARGAQRYSVAKSPVINIDNGAGTTADYPVLANLPKNIRLISVQAVYTEATDTAGAASANFAVGVTAGGATLVGATALAVSKAIGATTTGTILVDLVPAGSTLFVRHTGVATTEVGEYFVQVVYEFAP